MVATTSSFSSSSSSSSSNNSNNDMDYNHPFRFADAKTNLERRCSPSSVSAFVLKNFDVPTQTMLPQPPLLRIIVERALAAVAAHGGSEETSRRPRRQRRKSGTTALPRRTNQKRTTVVAFSSSPPEYKDTLSRWDMTRIERKRMWLQNDEALFIKQRCRSIIDRVEQQHGRRSLWNGRALCVRGLEKRIGTEKLLRQQFRRQAKDEVFATQHEQFEAGIRDHKAIAIAYSKFSLKCQFDAEVIANRDRSDANSYLLNNNRNHRVA